MQGCGERPWYRNWPEDVPRTIEYPEISAPELLRLAAERTPSRSIANFYGKTRTYAELERASDRFAAGLQRIGVRPGDRVSLILPNTPHYLVAFFGVLKAGAIVVQTSPLYTPRELENQLNDSGAETVVVLNLFWHNLAEAKPSTRVKRVVVCDAAEFLPAPQKWLYPLKRNSDLKKAGNWPLNIPDEPWVHRFSEIASTSGHPSGVNIGVDDVAVLQYTGGTTGLPKGAMLTHRILVVIAYQTSRWAGKREQADRGILPIPLFHIFGLMVMLMMVALGGEAVLEPNPRDIRHILELVRKTKPNVFVGVPTLYIALLNNPDLARTDLSGILDSLSGGAPFPLEVRRKWEALTGGRVWSGYGMSEAAIVSQNPMTKDGFLSGGVGIPVSDTDVRIVDMGTGEKEMALGEAGEVAVRGPQVMKGYWNRPEETAEAMRDGWLRTGDIGKIDERGILHIVERKKDMIDASGFKVYPDEVEEVLYAHPAVVEAAVVGVPDPYRGETVKAFIVKKPGSSVTEEEIAKFCRERLAPYKIPRRVDFINELPKSPVGKVLRRELREREQSSPPLSTRGAG